MNADRVFTISFSLKLCQISNARCCIFSIGFTEFDSFELLITSFIPLTPVLQSESTHFSLVLSLTFDFRQICVHFYHKTSLNSKELLTYKDWQVANQIL